MADALQPKRSRCPGQRIDLAGWGAILDRQPPTGRDANSYGPFATGLRQRRSKGARFREPRSVWPVCTGTPGPIATARTRKTFDIADLLDGSVARRKAIARSFESVLPARLCAFRPKAIDTDQDCAVDVAFKATV
jgi:hypothetical protein